MRKLFIGGTNMRQLHYCFKCPRCGCELRAIAFQMTDFYHVNCSNSQCDLHGKGHYLSSLALSSSWK